jgi:hypothetical protein
MGAEERANNPMRKTTTCDLGLSGCADKLTEKHRWLIYYERKILFWLNKQAKKDEL